MTFPIDKFEVAGIEQVSDTRTPKPRLFRYRYRGSKKPFWQINLTSVPLDYATGLAVAAYLDGLEGALTVFNLPCPIPALASYTGLTVASAVGKDASTVTVTGLPANQAEALMAGDFIQFAGSPKAYRLTKTTFSNASGDAIAWVTPRLMAGMNSGVAVSYGDAVQFQVAMEKRNSADVDAKKGKFMVHDVELIEQL